MDSEFGRRPLWPWLCAVVVAVVGVAVLCTQAQAMARDAERHPAPTAAPAAGAEVAGAPRDVDAAGAEVAGDPREADAAGVAPSSSEFSSSTDSPSLPAVGGSADVIAADSTWVSTIAARTGIPARALRAYATAALTLRVEQPGCGLGWNTLAGLGAIESGHGTHSGGRLRDDGYPDPPIRGIALDGSASASIADTDGGSVDGDATWDRAVGPLQFIPSTWRSWGVDANGDGVADPNQIDDAALAAGRYLCAAGEMTSPAGWRRAVFSYNHLDSYVDDVAAVANTAAGLAG